MRILQTVLILILAGLITGCASYGYEQPAYRDRAYSDFSRAAYQVEVASDRWYRQTGYRAPGYIRGDAETLLRAARNFRQQVERGGDPRHLRDDYAHLLRSYSRARDNLAGPLSHRPHRQRHGTPGEFRDVEIAVANLDRLVNRYVADGGRYDRGAVYRR
jgi:hypothetical protein